MKWIYLLLCINMYISAFFPIQHPVDTLVKRLLFAHTMQTGQKTQESPSPENLANSIYTAPNDAVIKFNESKLDFFPNKNRGNILSRIFTAVFHPILADNTWNHVFKMIDQGADIDICDENGDGLLAYAVFYDRPDYLEKLIKRGAKVDMKNGNGLTLLEQLCSYQGTHYKNTFDMYADCQREFQSSKLRISAIS